MDYSYNANLSFEERVNKIASEIIKIYDRIDIDTAYKIASIEMPIDNDDIDDAKFKRLSNILFFCKNDEVLKNILIDDILKNYKLIINKNEKIDNYVNDILVYKKYNTELPLYK